ncbi:hypothetical protein BH23PLA1_BH23PLA1_21490 [soil metagenome]
MKAGRRWNRKWQRRSGAAAVEMALIMPLFVTLILGTIEAARIGMVVQLLNVAAREGCRTAVLEGRKQADVDQRIDQIFNGTDIDPDRIPITPQNWTNAPGGTAITVRLEVDYDDISWLGNPFQLSNMRFTAAATMSSERP